MTDRDACSTSTLNPDQSGEAGRKPEFSISPIRGGESSDGASSRSSVGGTVLGYSVVMLFLGLTGYYIYSHGHEFAFVARASVVDLVLAGVCVIASLIISAFQLGLFLGTFGVSMGFTELLALTMTMCLGNMVTPMRGGTGALAIYLKKKYSLDFHSFALIYGGTGLLIALMNSGLAFGGLIYLWLAYGFIHVPLSVAVAGLFALCLYLSIFPPSIKWQRQRSGIVGLVVRTANSWHEITRDRRLMTVLTGSFLATSFFLAASFFFVYRALGTELSATAVVIVSSLGNIANLFGFTPGSIGIFDAVVIQIPRLLGLDTARAIAAALTIRALLFGSSALLGIPGIMYLLVVSRRRPARPPA